MRTLFIYPEFPKTFWSYEKILELVNRKVLLPPLGMVTVAALLPPALGDEAGGPQRARGQRSRVGLG